MHKDKYALAPIYNVLKRKSGIILEQDETGILVFDGPGNVLLICQDNPDTAVKWTEKYHRLYPQSIVVSLNPECTEAIKKHFDVETLGGCSQVCARDGDNFGPAKKQLYFKPAGADDYPWIRKQYDLTGDEEIHQAIAENRLFIGYLDPEYTTPVGFGGEHGEGSMGFLEILPEFRRQGYALEFGRFLIDYERNKGMIPYAHIFNSNKASLALQKKAGMYFCDNEIEWMWLK